MVATLGSSKFQALETSSLPVRLDGHVPIPNYSHPYWQALNAIEAVDVVEISLSQGGQTRAGDPSIQSMLNKPKGLEQSQPAPTFQRLRTRDEDGITSRGMLRHPVAAATTGCNRPRQLGRKGGGGGGGGRWRWWWGLGRGKSCCNSDE